MSMRMENCAHKRVEVHVTNTVIACNQRKCAKLVLKPFATKNSLSIFGPIYCSFLVDYTISVTMMTALTSCTLYNLFI